jgi:hypothetical protein
MSLSDSVEADKGPQCQKILKYPLNTVLTDFDVKICLKTIVCAFKVVLQPPFQTKRIGETITSYHSKSILKILRKMSNESIAYVPDLHLAAS